MVLSFVQKTIADIIGEDRPNIIGLDFSFANDKRLKEEDFFTMLEVLEQDMKINLVNCAWRFETVKQLVDYINKHRLNEANTNK